MNVIMFLLSFLLVTMVYAIPPINMYEDQIAEESIDNENYFTSYAALPKHIFNDGKPFIVGKDPVTGQIDFNTKKTVSSSNSVNDMSAKVSDTGRPSDVNQIAPNIHDFLNLPVKYSSSKSVYPLISSSYSNLKYQGNNKHFVSNHKESTTTTTSPKYYTNTMIIKSTSVKESEVKATKRPMVSTSSMSPFSLRRTSATTSMTTPRYTPKLSMPKTSTTVKPVVISTTSKYNTKKYQDSSSIRKKLFPSSTILPKVEIKKLNLTQPQSHLNVIPLTRTTPNTTTTTTSKPTTGQIFTTNSVTSSTANTAIRFPNPTDTSSRPFSSSVISSSTQETKITTDSTKNKAPSLSDLFSLWSDGEDYYYDEHTEKSDVKLTFESNKLSEEQKPSLNYIEPPLSMLPNNYNNDKIVQTTKPSSTTLRTTPTPTVTISSTTSIQTTTSLKPTEPQPKFSDKPTTISFPTREPTKIEQPIPSQASFQDKRFELQPTTNKKEESYVNFNSGSVPSSNTFVISPEQNSASFVLGSQQSFGTEGHFVGSAIKEVPYESVNNKFLGTVINEIRSPDIIPQGFSIKVQPQPNVRFPTVNKPSEPIAFDDAPIVHGTIKKDSPPIPDQSFSMAMEQEQPNVQFPGEKSNMTPHQMNIELIKAIDEQLASETNPNQVIFKDDVGQNVQNIQPPSQDLTPPGDGPFVAPQFFEYSSNGQGMPPPHIYGEKQRPDQRRPVASQQPMPTHNHRGPMQQMHGPLPPQRLPLNDRSAPMQNGVNHGKHTSRPMLPPQIGPQYRVDRVPGPSHKPHVIPDRMLMQDRPEAGQPLPNILPQFRPNAKVSQGHVVPKKDVGSIKVTENSFKKLPPHSHNYYEGHSPQPHKPDYFQNKPPSNIRHRPGPSFIVRRTSPQNRFVSRISQPYSSHYSEEVNPNRRNYYPGSISPDRMLSILPPNLPPQRFLDPTHPAFDRNSNINTNPLVPPPQLLSSEQEILSRNNLNIQRFREEHHTNAVPTTDKPMQDLNMKRGKLEPVITLQMLQAKKMAMKDQERNIELPVLKETVPEIPVAVETSKDNKPVYVVYPIREDATEDDASSAKASTPTGSEYQNTPFSVVSHFEQEPILMLKEKSKPTKSAHFPYAIEKPNMSDEFQNNQQGGHLNEFGTVAEPIYNTGELPSSNPNGNINHRGQVISTTLTRVTSDPQTTSRPIAIAYTPSPRPINPQGPHIYDSTSHEMYSMPSIITHEAQTEQTSYFHDYDYDHRIKESFQAPFYASANLPNKATQANKFEGWSIATPGPIPQFSPHYDNNQIDRSDTNVIETETESMLTQPESSLFVEITTKKFDPNNFQPEFLTGFQPIYTSDIHVKESTKLEPNPREGETMIEVNTENVRVDNKLEPSRLDDLKMEDSLNKDVPLKENEPVRKKPVKEIDSLEAFFNALVNYDDTEDYTSESSTNRGENN